MYPCENWKYQGNCATESGDNLVYFMPDFSRYGDRLGSGKEAAIAKATAICQDCPVIVECEEYRRAHKIVWGIWAGVYHAPTRNSTSRSRAENVISRANQQTRKRD